MCYYHVTKAIMYELAASLDVLLPLRDLPVSNLHKQHSLIATSQISRCLPQLQIAKSKNFRLRLQIAHTPTPQFQGLSFFNSWRKIEGEPFYPWGVQENLTLFYIKYCLPGNKR